MIIEALRASRVLTSGGGSRADARHRPRAEEREMIRRAWIEGIYRRVLALGAILLGLAVIGMSSVAAIAQSLLQTSSRYPRIRRLPSGELIATVLMNPVDFGVRVFSSTNYGASSTHVGTV